MPARVAAPHPRPALVYGENHEICGRTGTLCVLTRPQISGCAGSQARMVRPSFSRLVRLRAAARGVRKGVSTRWRPTRCSSTVTVVDRPRQEEQPSELQSIMTTSYSVLCLQKHINTIT